MYFLSYESNVSFYIVIEEEEYRSVHFRSSVCSRHSNNAGFRVTDTRTRHVIYTGTFPALYHPSLVSRKVRKAGETSDRLEL